MNDCDVYVICLNGDLVKVDYDQWMEFVLRALIAVIKGTPHLC